jgi:Lrp/AsnC family leucine-responsive transcriptional regulator
MSQIDVIDEQILGELQANGRLTMKALAERVGLSSPAMIERVRRLEDRGIISGYRAIVAPESLGRSIPAVILARVANAHDKHFDAVIEASGAITEVHRLTGSWTHVIRAHVAELSELERLVDDLRVGGAICEPSLITSSPVHWREMTPPASAGSERQRGSRRGRPGVELPAPNDESMPAPRRRGPGRPRTRPVSS